MKKKELLIIIISILATLTITISGYILYKDLNENKNNKDIEEREERISKLQSKIEELNDSIKQSKEKDTEIDEKTLEENKKREEQIVELQEQINELNKQKVEENSFSKFASNLKKNSSNGDINKTVNEDGRVGTSLKYNVKLTKDGELYFSDYTNVEMESKYKNYKIASNVLDFYILDVGNGGLKELYFISNDGSVGTANIELFHYSQNSVITVKNNIQGLKNIIRVVNYESTPTSYPSSGGAYVAFIDINGNIYK